jgi:hypothetical protein
MQLAKIVKNIFFFQHIGGQQGPIQQMTVASVIVRCKANFKLKHSTNQCEIEHIQRLNVWPTLMSNVSDI